MERITQAIKHLIIINVVLFFVAELGLVLHLKELMAIWYFSKSKFFIFGSLSPICLCTVI
ncbi:hypothetical protein CCAN12_680055 [Capnocytophaga canimorsus]|uniref:Uncharacterized protein n=1 Tax=Capnocytophaga canimorsus TaxID=28188 RepID=A0A0B7HBG3_9FLAO|nr:hypothetical protein CCAN12_680055 [Capnocytophaga canimorsus]